MHKGWLAVAFGALLGAGTASKAPAATISLRPGGDAGESSLVLVPGSTGSFEIVLELAEGEQAEFVTAFLDAVIVPEVEGAVVELFDLEQGFDSQAAIFARPTPFDVEFPLAEGEGIDIGDYLLLLSDAGLTGPGTFVLERVHVRALNLGEATVSYALGDIPPDVYDLDNNPVATEVDAAPLVIEVNEAITVEPPDNANDNGDPDSQPAPTTACGAGTCGGGAGMTLTLGMIGLAAFRRRS